MQGKMIVTRYEMAEKRLGLRLALVSDLHNCEYYELLNLLKSESPDVILAAGDILERLDENECEWTAEKMEKWQTTIGKRTLTDKVMWIVDRLVERNGVATQHGPDRGIEFLKAASNIAPLYYSVGNHEWYFTSADYQVFADHKITLLDNADRAVVIGGKQILIGGLSTRYDMEWLRAFSKKDGFKILMCHHPGYYRKMVLGTEMDTFGLIVGGHYHGGQWRLLNRSVYVPRTGLFVKDAVGRYERLIISAGVANTTKLPRLGNPCELVMIEI